MKKIILFLILICFFINMAGFVSAEIGGWQLEVGIPGIKAKTPIKEPGQYLEAVFKFAVMLAAILAVVMIIFGGFLWMTAPAIANKEKGREMIYGAISGLILLLASYLILYTINPALTGLKGPELADVNINTSGGGGGTGGGGNSGGGGGGGGGVTDNPPTGSEVNMAGEFTFHASAANDTVGQPYLRDQLEAINQAGNNDPNLFYINHLHGGLHSADSWHYSGFAADIVPGPLGSGSWSGPDWDRLRNAIQQANIPYLEEGAGTSNHHFHISPNGR